MYCISKRAYTIYVLHNLGLVYERPGFDFWWRLVARCVNALLWLWHKEALNKCTSFIIFFLNFRKQKLYLLYGKPYIKL